MLRVLAEEDAGAEMTPALDEICREGARRMLAAALEAERDAYLATFADERDDCGHRLVVGNGHARPRVIATGAGPIEVEAPRVNDRRVDDATGERVRFRSQILAPWCRKSPKAAPSTVESVRLDPELKDRLARRAEDEGVPVSEVIREALRHHLEAS